MLAIKRTPIYQFCSNPWCHGHLLGYRIEYDDGSIVDECITVTGESDTVSKSTGGLDNV